MKGELMMSRKRRFESRTNIYHVMLRGVNRQQIFYDEEDYRKFQHLLAHYKSICGYKLYAYCIMGNHIHMLIQTGEEPLEIIFKRIGTTFVYWYNAKYERVGHLFQDRYRCEPVETEAYFRTVLRYILRNPVAAGICCHPAEYPYSSARAYMKGEGGITDTAEVFERYGQEEFKYFLDQENEDKCMEMDEVIIKRVTDTVARQQILQEFGTMTPSAGFVKTRHVFRQSMKKLHKQGMSIRQISRLTGLPKKIVENSLK